MDTYTHTRIRIQIYVCYRLSLSNVRNKYYICVCVFFFFIFRFFLLVEFVATCCKTFNYFFLRGFRLQLIFASAVCIHTYIDIYIYIDISLYSSVYIYVLAYWIVLLFNVTFCYLLLTIHLQFRLFRFAFFAWLEMRQLFCFIIMKEKLSESHKCVSKNIILDNLFLDTLNAVGSPRSTARKEVRCVPRKKQKQIWISLRSVHWNISITYAFQSWSQASDLAAYWA